MNFIKKTNILQLLLPILVLSSCDLKNKVGMISENIKPKDTMPHMEPPTKKLPKLSTHYSNTKRNTIEHFFNKNWSNNSLNGSFLVAQNGQIIFERYEGMANFREKRPITATTPLHLASVSKVLTAAAVLKLVDAKKISLDQKVNTIITNFPFPEVTVKTLLNHRSGMRNYAYFTDKKDGVWDRHNILRNTDIVHLMATKNVGLESRTDSRFAYCNTNYAVLALIIEKETGLSYKKAMERMIFKPLGMNHTFVFDYDKDKDSVVPSYKGNKVEIGKDYLDAIYGDKNIYSTPRDLLKFELARNNPNFLSPKLLKLVYTPFSNERKGEKNYGLGIRMINWESGQNFYFHNGWWHGNTSSYITLLNEHVTIIALSNKYTTKTYQVKKLAALFGDYPFQLGKDDKEE